MYWANFLHFYQPPDQKREIVSAIAAQTYNPVIDGLLEHDHGRLTVNLAGSLLELLHEFDHDELIAKFAEAGRRGLIEFVGTSKYHAILPMLPLAEVKRQIEINDATSRHFLGDAYQPRGLFLPESAYHPKLAPLFEELGFDWVLLDELAYNGKVDTVDETKTYIIEGTKLKAFFRQHRESDILMAASTHTVAQTKEALGEQIHANSYLVTGLDGETFGHHRVGHERLLLDLLANKELKMVTISELIKLFPTTETVATVASTWASNEADLEDGIPYITWSDPANDIHTLQWELAHLAIAEMSKLSESDPNYHRLRGELDPALSSDQFFWSAARPWWMIEHIERGANMLVHVIEQLPTATPATIKQAIGLYHQVLDTAWSWQRSGKIDSIPTDRENLRRIPFREQTLETGGEKTAVWEAFMHLFSEREANAVKRRDYEAAALWRDAKYKLETKIDIYDAFHVIDMLRARLPNKMVEEALERYRKEYNHIRGGQSEQRSH